MMFSSTTAAFQTFRGMVKNLFREGLRLRIVAPQTMQRTSFQEYRCTNPRAIVSREMLDVEYKTLHGAKIHIRSESAKKHPQAVEESLTDAMTL